MRKLHREWFPLNYPDSFYDKLLHKPQVLPIGCFLSVPKDCEDNSKRGRREFAEVMLGSIISRMKTGKDDIVEICEKEEDNSFKAQSSSLVYMMSKLFCAPYQSCRSVRREHAMTQGCYIMTLGILDECRSMGLGTLLLNETFVQTRKLFPTTKFAYLHVVDYNKAAINFYLKKNGFRFLKVERDHYEIFEKEYDAWLLYCPL